MDAITEAIAQETTECAIVTRWVLAAEAIDHDGQPTMITHTSPGLPQYAALGMHQWAAQAYVPQPNWTLEDEDES